MKQRWFTFILFLSVIGTSNDVVAQSYANEVAKTLKKQILSEAAWAIKQEAITVTAQSSSRSAGGKHDFFSEGDYWWPDPQNPTGPYIQKDGLTNPEIFVAHRLAMIRFSRIIGAFASAYKLTGEKKYAIAAVVHLKAWFSDPATLMNPNLLYAQAIQGRFTGRGIGIIDTIQLMEVAQGILVMQQAIEPSILKTIKQWFTDYLTWLTSHQYGKDELNAKNNHGTCWVMQVASFATLTGDKKLLDFCRERYQTVLLPDQMAIDGSFPLELARTKPFGYSIFNLDAMTMICQILTVDGHDLWNYKTGDGRSIKKGIEFLYPFVADKNKWPFKKDVMYWENWPVAQPFLVMGANAYHNADWLNTWKKLEHQPNVEEVIRNLPIRHPYIWLN
ncbi:alginate lyase [Pedobacter frigiditerrae]|uniref:Alginate lyase n=1 Tax=Pedobacter frigiditerrae TaxID=2530452 RepID=A0A4R0MQF7_9SPHI|nr:alginate lyase family protein [Pedobacter frigiditerrae]TCC89080.1 alginate lyase [Pedobacter frigiditerrae]